VNELFTKRSPIIPPRLFKTRTTSIILLTTFLHALTFFAGAYYLPLYYQVLGASATMAGVWMIPFSFGAASFSAISGVIVTRTGEYRLLMWIAFALFTVGYGLMIMLDAYSSTAEKILFPFIGAIGLGCLFQTPLIGLQAAMPIKDMATSTATFGFLRTLGGTVGISIGQAVYSSILVKKVADLGNVNFPTSPAALSQNVGGLHSIPDPTLRAAIIQAYAQSISYIWLVMTPILGACFILVLFLRKYTLKRTFVHAEDQKTATGAGDLEKGRGGDSAEVEENEAPIGAVPMTVAGESDTSKSATSQDG